MEKGKTMTDYIKRDIERIIANAQECDIDALTWEEQKERLKAVKSADVVPVMRCKDCKHCNTDWAMGVWYGSCRKWNTHSVMADWFCVQGERKEDGKDD